MPTMSDLHALNDQYYETDNKTIFKKFNSLNEKVNIWKDFLRINKTHFKARFEITSADYKAESKTVVGFQLVCYYRHIAIQLLENNESPFLKD